MRRPVPAPRRRPRERRCRTAAASRPDRWPSTSRPGSGRPAAAGDGAGSSLCSSDQAGRTDGASFSDFSAAGRRPSCAAAGPPATAAPSPPLPRAFTRAAPAGAPLVTVAPFWTFSSTMHAGRTLHLEDDLVGLEVDEVLVAADRVAGLLVPRDQVASATDSGSCGTRLRSSCVLPGVGGTQPGGRRAAAGASCAWAVAAQRRHESLLLSLWSCGMPVAGRPTVRGRPYSSSRAAERLLQAVADLEPRALVLRLLLAPDDVPRVRVARQDRRTRRPGTDRAARCGPRDVAMPLRRGAPRAGRSRPCPLQNTTATAAGSISSISSITLRKRRRAKSSSADTEQLVAQQALRRHHHQRLAERAASAGAACGTSAPASTERTIMLFSAQSCRKRSRRADECSGPGPRSRAAGTS